MWSQRSCAMLLRQPLLKSKLPSSEGERASDRQRLNLLLGLVPYPCMQSLGETRAPPQVSSIYQCEVIKALYVSVLPSPPLAVITNSPCGCKLHYSWLNCSEVTKSPYYRCVCSEISLWGYFALVQRFGWVHHQLDLIKRLHSLVCVNPFSFLSSFCVELIKANIELWINVYVKPI